MAHTFCCSEKIGKCVRSWNKLLYPGLKGSPARSESNETVMKMLFPENARSLPVCRPPPGYICSNNLSVLDDSEEGDRECVLSQNSLDLASNQDSVLCHLLTPHLSLLLLLSGFVGGRYKGYNTRKT